MRLCNFRQSGDPVAHSGMLVNGRVYLVSDIVHATASREDDKLSNRLISRFSLGLFAQLREQLEIAAADFSDDFPSFDPAQIEFLPPVHPVSSFRDSYCFEEHVRNARAKRGLEVAPEWYENPVYYFSNPHALYGHGQDVPAPTYGQWLDYELEVAAVIGREGRDIPVEEAESYIAGYCVLNDWSLRDVQRKEMAVGLGPCKGKDFATSLGPCLVTPDELEDRRSGKGFDLTMSVRVNGREVASNNWNTIHFSFAEMLARFSLGATLYPGDVIGSGTAGRGCMLETGPAHSDGSPIGSGVDGWLGPGDVVELEVERLGLLRSNITAG